MTVLDRIRQTAQTAHYDKNSKNAVLSDVMLEAVMPTIIKNIDKQCEENGLNCTYNRPEYEYPNAFYRMLWVSQIRKTVLEYLEEHKPMAWFKPMYFTEEQQVEFFKNK